MDNSNNKFRFDNIFNEPIKLTYFNIHQIGDLYCEYDTLIDTHKQSVFEISFIASGKGYMSTNSIPTLVTKGDIYISLVGDQHKIISDKTDTLRYYYLALSTNSDSIFNQILTYIQINYIDPKKRLFKIPYIFSHMQNVLNEISQRNEFSDYIIESNITQILIFIYRLCKKQMWNLASYNMENKKGLVYNLINYIDNNFCTIKNLNELSSIFSYNYIYLSKLFKQYLGKTMQTYLQEKQFEYAKQLLTFNKKSISEISEILNFSSPNNFSRAFKSYYKMSPQQYLHNYNNL